jgi:hypothetical protein
MPNDMTTHLNEDELVLHYYGEMSAGDDTRAAAHVRECGACHASYTKLQRVLAVVEAAPGPDIADDFERTVWARLQAGVPAARFVRGGVEPELGRERRGWISWFVLSPPRLAWIGAVLVLIAGAFFAGRVSRSDVPASGTQAASAASVREGVLLVDLRDHLDRSQMMLVELVSAGGDGEVNISAERARAEELVSDNRLYRQTAEATGNMALATVLDELERVLVELAASPDELSAVDLERVRERIESRGLLFKVRVLSSDIRERQKTGIRMRTGQSS